MSKPAKYTGGFERSLSILYRERFPRFLTIQRLSEEERTRVEKFAFCCSGCQGNEGNLTLELLGGQVPRIHDWKSLN